MNTTLRPDMFHDEAAHRLEWLLAIPVVVAASIFIMYALLYHGF